jgi:hypothetical protein
MRLTSLRLTRSPRLSTSWSTRRVLTPHTYACWTTDNNAYSERFLGCRKPGKCLPWRTFGICNSISPARVSHLRAR